MVALADLVDLRGAFRSEKRRIAKVRDVAREAVILLEISSVGFRASRPEHLAPGEAIKIEIPALGPIDARVTWVEGREFGGEYCDASDLRLLFLRKCSVNCSSWFERRGY